ncbi:hypothetical protein K0M31_007952 [Melipona bicolor]|uniref:Uncharacterized protein n=1 Tax=Melipona bicolor TaxID=60889 RepID=A0AA40KW76_9HYME|nr:hypothetical protein K0M31_007952 [Melipona bicolor]
MFASVGCIDPTICSAFPITSETKRTPCWLCLDEEATGPFCQAAPPRISEEQKQSQSRSTGLSSINAVLAAPRPCSSSGYRLISEPGARGPLETLTESSVPHSVCQVDRMIAMGLSLAPMILNEKALRLGKCQPNFARSPPPLSGG